MALTRREAALMRRRLRIHDGEVLADWVARRGDPSADHTPPTPPPLGAKTTLSVRVDYATLAALDSLAGIEGVLPTALAREYICDGIARAAAHTDPAGQLAYAARLLLDAQRRLA